MFYQKIEKMDMNNGPGLRVSIWVSGCSNNCRNCFNVEGQDPNFGTEFTEETIEYILEKMKPEEIDGLSILGGDPLFYTNEEVVTYLCKRVRERYGNTKTIWLWTGYTFINVHTKELFRDYLVDVVIDGKFIEELKDPTLKYAGSSNQNLINVKEWFER